jgi:hypothetical protein
MNETLHDALNNQKISSGFQLVQFSSQLHVAEDSGSRALPSLPEMILSEVNKHAFAGAVSSIALSIALSS